MIENTYNIYEAIKGGFLMKRKMIRNLSLTLIAVAGVFTFVFGFKGETNAASSTSNSIHELKIDTVDGVKYSPDKHKKIAGIVIEINDQGERILGFSTQQKFEAYHQQTKELSSNTPPVETMAGRNYFYEHTSNQGHGNSTWLDSGKSRSNLGTIGWNDRISAVGVAPKSWVRLFKNVNYGGTWIQFSNQTGSRYDYTNLTSFSGWNDQTSSIQTGIYH